MALLQAPENQAGKPDVTQERQSGIALFMVIASISVLSILVTEFAYIAQMNKKIAYDGLDQLKAHYLAKSGLKLSLLRLKAYQTVKGVVGGSGGQGAIPGLPKQVLEKIWSFPFFYPIPTNVPGITQMDKDRIEKFQKSSSLDGKFSALIESESSKYNLNLILAPFAPTGVSGPTGASGPTGGKGAGGKTGPTGPTFNPDDARKSLGDYLYQIVSRKAEEDPDFATEYRDWRIEDFMDNVVAWADLSYERRSQSAKELVPMKRGPFYSLTELHMIPGMDDRLYGLLAPALTVSTTPGINVNTMKEATIKALIPQMTAEELTEFFKFRDDEEQDNYFKDAASFFKWVQGGVGSFRNSDAEIAKFKEDLNKRNIRIVVDETEFRIIVQAIVNQSTRLIEAYVTLSPPQPKTGIPPAAGGPARGGSPTIPPPTAADSGLRITFMRIL